MMTSKFIDTTRKDLDKEVKGLWSILKAENMILKTQKRNWEMKAVYNKIKSLSKDRAKYKMYSLMLNLGFKKEADFNKAIPENIYSIIYELSEIQEILVKLDSIPVYNPDMKAKKGKKSLSKTEELTYGFIKKEKNMLQIEVNALKKKLNEFNEKAVLEVNK